ncbi:RNA polymerase sigma factor [Paenibacillus marinisediminis]
MNPDETIKAIAVGDTDALKDLYDELRYIVYSVALSILRKKSSAEDVLQDTFVRVYEKAATYKSGTNAKAWVISIARNLAYDALRRDKREFTNEIDEEPIGTKSSFNSTETIVLHRLELTEALFRLGEIERQIVVMHLVAGLKHSEISEELGIPAGTVRWKYRKSLTRLAEIIGGGESGSETFGFRATR